MGPRTSTGSLWRRFCYWLDWGPDPAKTEIRRGRLQRRTLKNSTKR